MNPATGEQFGPYQILGTLGRGGVGEVYRAWDARLEREVAVKLLHDEYPQHGNRERFMIEARAASALSHPNICTVFDMGQKDGAPYLVMELLRGETLKQRIERGAIPAEEIAQYGLEVAEALGAAHALGIVHRDIKPANVMLVPQPDGRMRVKVLDFGLAKLTGALPGSLAQHSAHLTVVGEAVGTVSYMSPEQARGNELDGRSDLFSLGVVMYEMATRRTPFQGSTTALLFVQLLNENPEPIRDWNEDVPRALEKVIFRLLEKEPERRYQTAAEVIAALANMATKAIGPRWRRAAPAVPLVRVEEPVARAPLPARPESRRSPGRVGVGFGSHASARPTLKPSSRHSPLPGTLTPSGAAQQRRATLEHRISAHAQRSQLPEPPAASVPPQSLPQPHPAAASPVTAPRPVSDARYPVVAPIPNPTAAPDHVVPPPSTSPELTEAPLIETAAAEPIRISPEEAPLNPQPSPAASPDSAVSALSWAGGHFLRIPAATGDSGGASRRRDRHRRIRLGVAAAAIVSVAAVLAIRAGHRAPALLGPGEALLITTVDNRTGVETLDGSVAQGLELALAETPGLNLRGPDDYVAALHRANSANATSAAATPAEVARSLGVKAFLYGEVRPGQGSTHGSGAGLTVSVWLKDTRTGRELAHAQSSAERTEQIPGVIDDLASELRQQLGLAPASSSGVVSAAENLHTGVPLAEEATGSLKALHEYALATQMLDQGKPQDALRDFGLATAADPNFVQALVATSWLAADQDAQPASARAARQAQAVAATRSSRTALLAQIALAVNAHGDLEQATAAARRLLDINPHDAAAQLASARAFAAQGRYADAMATVDGSLVDHPADPALTRQRELLQIALGHYSAALATEGAAARAGAAHTELELTARFLSGRPPLPVHPNPDTQQTPPLLVAEAVALDNTGDFAAGAAAWQDATSSSRLQPALVDAGPLWVARAALNRALAGRCASAGDYLQAVAPATLEASADSDAAVAAALCAQGEPAQNAPSASSAPSATTPQVRAARALAAHDPATALQELEAVQHFDPTFLAPYLRGLAHLAAQDPAAATLDFRQVVEHRGAAVLGGTNVFPLAQLGLARAYAASGDRSGSIEAFRSFLELWTGAGEQDALRREALAGVRGLAPSINPSPANVQAAPAIVVSRTPPRTSDRSAILLARAPQPPLAHRPPARASAPVRRASSAPPSRAPLPARSQQSYPAERKYPQTMKDSDFE